MITIRIKKRTEAGQWQQISIDEYAGKTIEQFFRDADGTETVADVTIDGVSCFFCGTEHWLERMKQKGPAVSFDYAIARLRDTRPELLQEQIPHSTLFADVFPGATVEEMTIQ